MQVNLARLISRFAPTRRTLTPTMLAAFTLSTLLVFSARAADPQVSNVQASQRAGTKLVDITYDVSDADSATLTISATVSTNMGVTYDLPATHFSGDYGSGITPGAGKAIVWDAGSDWDGQYSIQMRVKVTADDGSSSPLLPPDPATVATAPSNGVVTLIGASTAFLYTGTNAIQTGVATGAIDTMRVVVLRGSVLDQDGAPLPGVTVTVNNHSELGQTLTRTNGAYDLAVNGGGPVSLNFAKTGYLTIQRTLDLPWQDYVPVDDVVLKTADPNVMVANLPATNAQAVYGSLQTDTNGSRRAVVIIPANTRAYVFTAAGATQETDTLTTRLTEFTVGTNGPSAMPGNLPPMVAYTYALELAAEEAQVKIAGRDVLFSTNVYFYVENFLGMPTGIQVPMGYYDDTASAWIPSSDGRVVELAGTNANGLAELIVATNGVPADEATLTAMGFSDDERRLLAAQYGPAMTQTLWRVPIAHFSRHDPNYGTVPEAGAEYPKNGKPSTGQVNNPNGEGDYGRLDLENQVFQESIALADTPLRLHYSSARVPGFQGQTSLTIPLTGASYPGVLQRIHLKISIAGQNYTYYFAPSANLSYVFTWDGSDIYSRSLVGTMTATIRIGYEYQAYYALPPSVTITFGFPSGMLIPGNIIAPQPTILWQEHQVPLLTSSRSNGLGWWSLSEHHTYDPVGQVLHMGNGTDIDADAAYTTTIQSLAGNGQATYSGDGGPATNAAVDNGVGALAVSPDGTVYLVQWSGNNKAVRRVDTNGYIWRVAGKPGSNGGWSGDGGPATNAEFNTLRGIAVAPDGSLYICDQDNRRVRRVGTNGIINTVAGNGSSGWSGDGGPATNAAINTPHGIAVASDGTLYIADRYDHRIRRVSPDGIIQTLAGTGSGTFSGDGGPATNAALKSPCMVRLGPDGAVYVADKDNCRVRRIGTDGIINTVAGNGTAGFSGDGGAATNAKLGKVMDLAVGSEGTLYIFDDYRHVREVTSDGIIRTIAGTGNATAPFVDNAPAASTDIELSLSPSLGIAVGPDGTVYISASNHKRLLKICRAMPGVGSTDILVGSADGNRFYQFDPQGRHLKTYHAWTGAALLEFGYTNGYLSTVTDGDGNVTRIVRDGSGTPQKIVSQDVQETLLTLNANGFLSAVQNPAGETIQLGYTTNGLLTSVQGPNGAPYTYTMAYNSTGQVVSASDPAGGSSSLRRSGVTNGYEVASTSALGRAKTARVEFLPAGDLRRTLVLADGTTQEQWEVSNGTQTNRYPSGVVERWTEWPDPRFGMQAPVRTGIVVRLSSGLALTANVERVVALTNQSWTSVAYLTNTVTINGRTYRRVYAAGAQQETLTTPAGRVYRWDLDSQGRTTLEAAPGYELLAYTRDGRGRLTALSAGTREWTLGYDAAGNMSYVRDAMGYSNVFGYDLAGRMTNQTLGDGQSVGSTYDAHGNLTGVQPPGRSNHVFACTLVDLPASYTPPLAEGITDSATYYYWNLDRQLTGATLPDGRAVSNTYNSLGQRTVKTFAGGTNTYGYYTNGLLATNAALGNVTLGYTYDGALLTAARWSGTVTGSLAYAYDNDFRMTNMAINGGNAAGYQYDADNLMTGAGLLALTRAATNGFLTGTALSNCTAAYGYSPFGELLTVTNIGNGTNVLTVNYGYDNLGRITNLFETGDDITNNYLYTYDAAGRLIRAEGLTNAAGFTNTYAYDANGNRTNWLVESQQYTAVYDAQDRLVNRQSATSTQQFFYNASGQLTNQVLNGINSTVYDYDALGNLRRVVLAGGITNDYLVDGLNRRVGKRVNGVLTNLWLWSGLLRPVAELDGNSNLVSVFVYATRVNVPDYMVKNGSVYRLVCDHLGSVRRVVEANTGVVMQRMDYDEWGRGVRDTNPGFQPFGFAGGLYDPDTALTRFWARDYDAVTGRWLSKDPLLFSAGSPNLYAYVRNDPLNYLDPSGLGPGMAWSGYGGTEMDFASSEIVPQGENVAYETFHFNTSSEVTEESVNMNMFITEIESQERVEVKANTQSQNDRIKSQIKSNKQMQQQQHEVWNQTILL